MALCDPQQPPHSSSVLPRDPKVPYLNTEACDDNDEHEDNDEYNVPFNPDNNNNANNNATPQATSTSPTLLNTAPPELTAEEQRIEKATRKAKQHSNVLKVFSGNGNMALALEIARALGMNLGKATVGRFADGEVNVVIHENVRGKDCYVIQPTCPPVNDNIMELLLMVSTLSRASARRITVVIPYYGYARQDRKMQVSQRQFNSISDVFLLLFVVSVIVVIVMAIMLCLLLPT